jgi:hypothetical protein
LGREKLVLGAAVRDILTLFKELTASEAWLRQVAERDGLAPADLFESRDMVSSGPWRDEMMITKASNAWSAALDLIADARTKHRLDGSEYAALKEMTRERYDEAWGHWSSPLGPLGRLAAAESRELMGAANPSKAPKSAGPRL